MKQFVEKVNLKSKSSMIDYLTNHFKYYTMNPWNNVVNYAQNVKLYKLGVGREMLEKYYEYMSINWYHVSPRHYKYNFWIKFNEIVEEFSRRWGYTNYIQFNGRSNGYLVLYVTKRNEDGSLSIYPGKTHVPKDIESYDKQMLIDLTREIIDFDKTVQKIVKTFDRYVRNFPFDSIWYKNLKKYLENPYYEPVF